LLRFDDTHPVPSGFGPTAVALGVFDGVHRGHQALFRSLVPLAERRRARSLVFTFSENPQAVLRDDASMRLCTLERKLELMAGAGVDAVMVQTFTVAFSKTEPETFIEEVLVGRLGMTLLLLGFNSCFGHRGRGNAELARSLAPRLGFEVEEATPVIRGTEPISSSRIRAAIGGGDFAQAEAMLGRPPSLDAHVVHGSGRGRTIGFPTANLAIAPACSPAAGVYATRAVIDGSAIWSVTNIGTRPTFDDETARVIETHLLDFDGDLYGKPLRLEFVARLRDEQRFDSAEALQAQIARDADAVRRMRSR
jgi:riboflavin kinase/FMN adenylyltransferase